MAETPVSLLERLRDHPDSGAWQQFVGLYTPLLRHWLRRYSLQSQDADDLVQEVLRVVVRELPRFQHSGRRGAFRHWLRAILVNCLRAFWRARPRPAGGGGGDPAHVLGHLEDPHSDLSRLWDQEHDRHVLGRLLRRVEADFTTPTWRAFRRLVLEAARAEDVAAELGLTVNAVLIAKSRVLQRLRQETRDLID